MHVELNINNPKSDDILCIARKHDELDVRITPIIVFTAAMFSDADGLVELLRTVNINK